MFRRLSDAQPSIPFSFDGREILAAPGETVAAALLAAGIVQFRQTDVSDTPRGPYCLMGVCFECLVTIDGVTNRQACMIPATAGLSVQSQLKAKGTP